MCKAITNGVVEEVALLLVTTAAQRYRGPAAKLVGKKLGRKGVQLLEMRGTSLRDSREPVLLTCVGEFFANAALKGISDYDVSWLRSYRSDEIAAMLYAGVAHEAQLTALTWIAFQEESSRETYRAYPLSQVALYGGALARWEKADPQFSVVDPALAAYSMIVAGRVVPRVDFVIAEIDDALARLGAGRHDD